MAEGYWADCGRNRRLTLFGESPSSELHVQAAGSVSCWQLLVISPTPSREHERDMPWEVTFGLVHGGKITYGIEERPGIFKWLRVTTGGDYYACIHYR